MATLVARPSSRKKADGKWKWEKELTESERAFVAELNPLLMSLARRNTPIRLRSNPIAVERSYMAGFKALCRAAQKYDSTLSAPVTYVFDHIAKEVRSFWRRQNGQFTFETSMMSENVPAPSGDTLALSNQLDTGERDPLDVLADAEQCRQAFRVLELYSPEFAAVMRLRYGFSHRNENGHYRPKYREINEIATIVKRSPSWVSWAIKRSLVLLKTCLKEQN
jgi:hypothetical protein